MKVMEIYTACQGEGVYIGQPSTFVRFFGCNLRCSWCDTAYSINPREYRESRAIDPIYHEMTPDKVTDNLKSMRRSNVVLTGGEPAIQPELVQLLRLLDAEDFFVTVETNGTLLAEGLKDYYDETAAPMILWSVSPKSQASSAAYGTGRAWHDPSVIGWYLRYAQIQLKFVISSADDYEQARAIVTPLGFLATRAPIVFQPNGDIIKEGPQAYLSSLAEIQRFVKESYFWRGFDVRVLPQLHVLLHGQRRFV